LSGGHPAEAARPRPRWATSATLTTQYLKAGDKIRSTGVQVQRRAVCMGRNPATDEAKEAAEL
jgi:hypothetical protein